MSLLLGARRFMALKIQLQGKVMSEKMSISDFILLALLSLNRNSAKKNCTFESVLKECFNLSPKTFSFPKNPNWPDARKIDRPLRSLRRKGLIKGSPDTSFSFTKKGKKKAEELLKLLRQKRLFQD